MYQKRQGRFDQDDGDGRSYFTPRYNQQRNNNNRFGSNQNRQRNNNNRSTTDSDSNWRRNDGYTNRQTQNRSTNNNNYNNRNNYNRNEVNENSVTIQSLVTDPESKKIVEEYRKNLIKDFQGSTSGSLENEKIVYSCKCIVKLSEIVNDVKVCPFTYNIFEKKIAEIDENCWDLTTTDDFSLSNGVDLIEQGRIEFLEKKREEQFSSVGRERAEVEAQLEQLEEEANGGSIFEMLSQRDIPLSQSPLPDDVSPRYDDDDDVIEGAIEGIIEPEEENKESAPIESEVLTEDDFIKAYKKKQEENSLPSSMGMLGRGSSSLDEENDSMNQFIPRGREEFGGYPSGLQNSRMGPEFRNDSQPMMGNGSLREGRLGVSYPSGNMMRPQDMNRDVSYVPNRFFNQLYPRQQPDLFQMFDESERQQQIRQQRYRQQMDQIAQQQLRQRQLEQMRYSGQDFNMRMGPGDRQGLRDGMPLMYGRGNPNNGMDRFGGYPGRSQEPMFGRFNNDHMMNYQNQNQYPYYQGSNQDAYYSYGFQ